MPTTYTLNDVDIAAVAALTEAITQEPSKADTVWTADVTWTGGFRSEAKIRDFDPVPSDEPTSLGGGNTAPNPVEQILGAFGNCLAVGVAANATARQIEIESLSISIEGELDLHTFLGLAADGNAGFSEIRARINLATSADAAQVDDLIEHVFATSPVGQTFAREVAVSVVNGS